MAKKTKETTANATISVLQVLQQRFLANMHRHQHITWQQVEQLLTNNANLLQTVSQMEATGGEPDVVDLFDDNTLITFCDCSKESPTGRRSLCYDKQAWTERKEYKPENNMLDVAAQMGITVLDEPTYAKLQSYGALDCKTSSWLLTPPDVRKLGGALFGDYRYGRVFTYHNGASSYYAARGFRGFVSVKTK